MGTQRWQYFFLSIFLHRVKSRKTNEWNYKKGKEKKKKELVRDMKTERKNKSKFKDEEETNKCKKINEQKDV